MEGALTARDRVGVQDFVLLENYTSEGAFLDNLRKRFKENLIYTYIGSVLVSVNPYKDLGIYTEQQMQRYRGVSFYEVPPHIYAVADNAFRALRAERVDQCVLISGESGAGKTEASKRILHFLALSCPAAAHPSRPLSSKGSQPANPSSISVPPAVHLAIRDRLLQSNPLLEAFGNAKTLKNDNSSRFGKYMDIQFDYKGVPVGGHIQSYLLEKSRVVQQSHGERNFHIFYQLLEGAEDMQLSGMGLDRQAQHHSYLIKGQCCKVSSIVDKNDWKIVRRAMETTGFSSEDVEALLGVIASVLHLGNLKCSGEESGEVCLNGDSQLRSLTRLLGVSSSLLMEALTHRKIAAKGEEVLTPLSAEQVIFARDALSKAIYGRTFNWLVSQINGSLGNKEKSQHTLFGLLDIYGFEVFQQNSFEQFCINYCNEKLQQLFIELTLRSEQEEYESEGIEWEPVSYFDNRIICDLVEEKHKGIISVLDEECLRPGEATDITFLMKLEETVGSHPHFLTHKLGDQKARKTLKREEFRLLHYAGDVNYNVIGFLDKNNDLLFRNLKEVMSVAGNPIISSCFPKDELQGQRRPETTATQFKASVAGLMDTLMSKEPSYVRCIKPNDAKQAGRFEDVLVRHQVKYLGLLENVRVRRAGFAYRRDYPRFLDRYKCLCPDTWPNWKGTASDGIRTLVKHIGYKPDEYKLGRSKIFIRFPKTLFATEDALEVRKHSIATKIEASWRGYHHRQKYLTMKRSVVKLQAWWRGIRARRLAARRREAADKIRRLIKGFSNRHLPCCPQNESYLDLLYSTFLLHLREKLPRSPLDKTWPVPPPALKQTSELLREMHMKNLVRCYCKKLTPERKAQLESKALASDLFKGKKESYPQSIPKPFVATHLDEKDIKNAKVLQSIGSLADKYGVQVTKFDRRGFKPRPRQLILGADGGWLLGPSEIKQNFLYSQLQGVSISPLNDGVFVLHIAEDNKGDVILESELLLEILTKLVSLSTKNDLIRITDTSIPFSGGGGRQGVVEFSKGTMSSIGKAKSGALSVVVQTAASTR